MVLGVWLSSRQTAVRIGEPRGCRQTSPLGSCPASSRSAPARCRSRYDHILLGHGSGGQLTADLIQRLFLPAFGNDVLAALEDQATVCLSDRQRRPAPRIAFTTDSFVVRPLFFPGGDIGRLAVHGTVNDLAVGGGPAAVPVGRVHPRRRAAAGRPEADRRLDAAACDEAGVSLVTGDTKVVDRGKGDGVFITTSGIGAGAGGASLSIRAARPGDRILVSGTLGDHGIAIMSVREGLEFETVLESDTAAAERPGRGDAGGLPRDPVHARPDARRPVQRPQRAGGGLGRGRGAGRGGDPAPARGPRGLRDARARPALRRQRGEADRRRAAGRRRPRAGGDARRTPWDGMPRSIGAVVAEHPGMVILRSRVGGERVVTLLAGEQLPRIC